jgi:hypothetical protein
MRLMRGRVDGLVPRIGTMRGPGWINFWPFYAPQPKISFEERTLPRIEFFTGPVAAFGPIRAFSA